MNSNVEKFLKGESKDSYNYFGSHKVHNGVCFRLYAPNAKQVEVVINNENHKMERIDFRGVYEVRVANVKEFDTYHYEILTEGDVWISKNDPYTFYNHDNKSSYLDNDQFVFNDERWMSKNSDIEYFNACYLTNEFKMDDQREFIEYLKKYNFNYLILKPYDDKYLYCVNDLFINESSLKTFIDNLHLLNIGVIFDFEVDTFFDYPEGLNEFDGANVYNLKENKYKEIDRVYFDYSKASTKSYICSFIDYYMNNFHGDGLFLNESSLNQELKTMYSDKLIIYKSEDNIKNAASYKYLDEVVDNFNKGFDHKKFINTNFEEKTYIMYDYDRYLKKIKGNEEKKKEVARMLLALAYVSNSYCISVYNLDSTYLAALEALSTLYTTSRALYGKTKRNLLYNGKKNNYFAYEYVSKNDYVLTMINFADIEEEKFDLGMQYYGYYKLILDTKSNDKSDELFFTREKKVHNKILALKMHLKPYQVLVYKRMRDI